MATALGDDGTDGEAARGRLVGETLIAPELIYLEIVSVWRRQVAAGAMTPKRALAAIADLRDLPISVASHRPLLARCWELRDDITCHDAAYVALAEALEMPLLTADSRLGRAPGLRCAIEVLAR